MQLLWCSWCKILLFLFMVVIIIIIVGILMYVIEGFNYGFISIFSSMYWVVVMMVMVGFGDIVLQIVFGCFVILVLIFIGYSIIVVFIGIYIVELVSIMCDVELVVCCDVCGCLQCGLEGYEFDVWYCWCCGYVLLEMFNQQWLVQEQVWQQWL